MVETVAEEVSEDGALSQGLAQNQNPLGLMGFRGLGIPCLTASTAHRVCPRWSPAGLNHRGSGVR